MPLDITLLAHLFAANFLALVCFGCALLIMRRILWLDSEDVTGFRFFLAVLLILPTAASVILLAVAAN